MPSIVAAGETFLPPVDGAVAGPCAFAARAAGETGAGDAAGDGSGCASQPIVSAPGCCGIRAPPCCGCDGAGSGCASQPIVSAPGCCGVRAPPCGCAAAGDGDGSG